MSNATTGTTVTFTTDLWSGDPDGASQMSIGKVAWGARDSVYNIVDDTSGKRLPVKIGDALPAGSAIIGALVANQTVVDTAAEASLAAIQASVAGTLAVSAASLPLPAGAATSALQTSGNSSLTTIATNSGTAATSALQTTGNTSLSTIATNTTQLAQGSTSSGQTGSLILARTLTSAPTDTTAQSNALTMTTKGELRVQIGTGGSTPTVGTPIDAGSGQQGLYVNAQLELFNGTTFDRARTATADLAGTATLGKLAVVSYEGTTTSFNITAATAVKASAGRLFKISVIVAGVAGTANDCATTGAAAAGNQVAVIPATVGVYDFNWPMATGIVIVPGAGQTVAISSQ
jgi:hypothetical protein